MHCAPPLGWRGAVRCFAPSSLRVAGTCVAVAVADTSWLCQQQRHNAANPPATAQLPPRWRALRIRTGFRALLKQRLAPVNSLEVGEWRRSVFLSRRAAGALCDEP